MQIVILAGGKGTRLGSLAADRPKPLVPIAGKPILEHQLDVARRYGLTRILMLTGHLGDQIAAHFGDGSGIGLQIDYVREQQPLGTAGAVKAIEALLDEEFLVVYGDIVFDMDLSRLIGFHRERGGVGSLVVHPNDHPQDSDLVQVDGQDRVVAFHRKNRPPGDIHRNLVNAGIYCLSRRLMTEVPAGRFLDFGLDVFPDLVGRKLPLFAYGTPEYLKDVGTLNRHARVEQDIVAGKVRHHNLDCARPAVFFDRDGVLNVEKGEGCGPDQFEPIAGTGAALARLNKTDHLAVVVTNQPGIAKGFLTEAEVDRFHARLETALGAEGAFLDRIMLCPHHPEGGFAGERPELKVDCDCRKPKPGMVLTAAERLNIDLGRSFLVGDRTVDIEAGRRAGVATVLVETGHGGRDGLWPVSPDFRCVDAAAAVALILENQWLIEPAAELAAAVVAESRLGPVGIAIGGLSRSGKTVFSRLLAWQLRRLGHGSRLLQLDDFLLSPEIRATLPSVRERFDYAAITAAVTEGMKNADGILIIEGVVALDVPDIPALATHRIFVDCEEAERRQRFVARYLARGDALEVIEQRYETRDREERAIIGESRCRADRVLRAPASGSPGLVPSAVLNAGKN